MIRNRHPAETVLEEKPWFAVEAELPDNSVSPADRFLAGRA